MTQPTNAEKHAVIARKVYPNSEAVTLKEAYLDGTSAIHISGGGEHHLFNMLETDSELKPTQQAKAYAFDTLTYMAKQYKGDTCVPMVESVRIRSMMECVGPYETIFNAAWEAVNHE